MYTQIILIFINEPYKMSFYVVNFFINVCDMTCGLLTRNENVGIQLFIHVFISNQGKVKKFLCDMEKI